jgi:hypothetical protein
MPAMHEDVHERAKQDQPEGQPLEDMRGVAEEKVDGHRDREGTEGKARASAPETHL